MIHQLGAAVYKRALGDDSTNLELPTWTPLVILLNVVLLLPIWVFTQYTLQTLYPTFAIIEDENPPAYEPLAATGTDEIEQGVGGPKPTDGQPTTVTSSIRSIFRLLRANGGLRANFRGLSIFLAQAILTNMLMGIFSSALGSFFLPVATLLATLALVQFSTAWVHIAITPASRLHFWSRLPPFKRTFDAVWKPVTLSWFATEIARWLPALLALVIGLELPTMSNLGEDYDVPKKAYGVFAGKLLAVICVTIIGSVFIVIPAHVILTRVQASLLPTDDETVIPFDGSFEGRIEPAVVGGRGYATISDAWATFSKPAWRRLIFLYIKVTLVSLALNVLAGMAIVFPSIMIVMKHSKVREE